MVIVSLFLFLCINNLEPYFPSLLEWWNDGGGGDELFACFYFM